MAYDEALHVAGQWRVGRAGTRDVINPFDASVIAAVPEADATDVSEAIAAARAAFDDGSWAATPVRERAAILERTADLLERDRDEIARTETLDTGKTLTESHLDVSDVVAVFRYFARIADADPGRIVDAGSPTIRSRIVYEPVGVCALIAPWNYPLLQVSWKIAPALAAGNTMVIKPSEVTPLTTILLVRLLLEAGVPDGVVNLVLGAGGTVGSALVADPRVDLVSFTGGLATGRAIMAAAADTVKKVALELGGKNPFIVFPDADLDAALDVALTAAFFHSGQVCSAGSRLILHESIAADFTGSLAALADRIHLGNGLDETSESGPLVSAAHRTKVEAAVGRAREQGAMVLAGGTRPGDPALSQGFFFRPTVLAACDRSMPIVHEEIFGPVVTVETFTSEEQAIALGNDTSYGLSGGVWTGDRARAQRIAGALRHGTVWINDFGPYLPQAEWGGFGLSGVGRELGPSGLAEYREAKHVYENLEPAPGYWFVRDRAKG
jgi:betaine-aldehyde dehydrogenase